MGRGCVVFNNESESPRQRPWWIPPHIHCTMPCGVNWHKEEIVLRQKAWCVDRAMAMTAWAQREGGMERGSRAVSHRDDAKHWDWDTHQCVVNYFCVCVLWDWPTCVFHPMCHRQTSCTPPVLATVVLNPCRPQLKTRQDNMEGTRSSLHHSASCLSLTLPALPAVW